MAERIVYSHQPPLAFTTVSRQLWNPAKEFLTVPLERSQPSVQSWCCKQRCQCLSELQSIHSSPWRKLGGQVLVNGDSFRRYGKEMNPKSCVVLKAMQYQSSAKVLLRPGGRGQWGEMSTLAEGETQRLLQLIIWRLHCICPCHNHYSVQRALSSSYQGVHILIPGVD